MKDQIIQALINCRLLEDMRSFRSVFIEAPISIYKPYLQEGDSLFDRATQNVELFLDGNRMRKIHKTEGVTEDKPPGQALYEVLIALSRQEVGRSRSNLENLAKKLLK